MSLGGLLDTVLDDWLGFNPPKAPTPIAATQPSTEEVISAGDRLRKRKTMQTNLGGNTGQPTISVSSLYGM